VGQQRTTPPDPAAFELDVVGLAGGLGITTGAPVGSLGHFAPLDDAGPDFDAVTLANLTDAPVARVRAQPLEHRLELSVVATSGSIQLDLSGTAAPGEVAVVDQGFAGSQPLPASPPAKLEPPASGSTLFFLTDQVTGGTSLYTQFSAFSKALQQAVAGGAEVSQVSAIGQYEEPTNTLVTPLVSACVK
jgi:hypothetical protein